jgi:pimeloyl-ACP methyl ester carboxylesterase
MTIRRIEGTVIEETGDGPTVILIHGLGLNRHMWQWQAPALEARHRVIRYDLLGHGDSRQPPDPVFLSSFSEQLSTVMNGVGLDRAAIIGFSLGGMIVRRFVMDHPGRATALGILNSAHDRTRAERDAIMKRVRQAATHGPAATIDAALERWFTPSFAERRPDVLDLVRQWVTANDPDIYPRVYKVLAEGDAEIVEGLGSIQCPALVMTGEEDFGNSPDMTRRMAESIPNAEAVILPGLRHMGLAEDPDRVNGLLLGFLDRAVQAST